MKSIYIYGASGHGLVVADIANDNGYSEIIFIDDGENTYRTFDEIKMNTSIPFALGIGSNIIRKKLFLKLKEYGFKIITLIHSSSIVSSSVKVDEGTIVMPNVVINASSTIGKGVILNTSCVIEHENSIGDFSHISPGSNFGGNVTIGKLTHIGIGTNIIQGISIKENCIIGAGSVVTKNINNNKLAYGNPCRVIKDTNE
jgi:UDP-N-acetylbacillosamine N-acetyltransferase